MSVNTQKIENIFTQIFKISKKEIFSIEKRRYDKSKLSSQNC